MDIKTMIATIQVYIHHRKGVEVQISPRLPDELPLLLRAYSIAQDWLNKNVIK